MKTLVTLLAEVKKILNDRPITRVSFQERPFRFGGFDTKPYSSPEKKPKCFPCRTPRQRWKQASLLTEEFWRRWYKEYLSMLQERQKWLRRRRNFAVGDLVLVADKTTPKGQWPKAIVDEVFPDRDGVVRRVNLRTATGHLMRDVSMLCMLEEDLIKDEQQVCTEK